MEDYRVKQKAQRPLVFLQDKFKKESGQRLPKWVVKSLIKKYGFQKTIRCLTDLNFSNKKNPIGYLTEAVRNDWKSEPEYLKQYDIKKAKEIKEANELRKKRGVETNSYLRQLELDNQKRQYLEKQKQKLLHDAT